MTHTSPPTRTPGPALLWCVKCGGQVEADWEYCRACGARQPVGPSTAGTNDPTKRGPVDVEPETRSSSSAPEEGNSRRLRRRVALDWAGLWALPVGIGVALLLFFTLPLKPLNLVPDRNTTISSVAYCKSAFGELMDPTLALGRTSAGTPVTARGCEPWYFGLVDNLAAGLVWFLVVAGVLFLIGTRREPSPTGTTWRPYRR